MTAVLQQQLALFDAILKLNSTDPQNRVDSILERILAERDLSVMPMEIYIGELFDTIFGPLTRNPRDVHFSLLKVSPERCFRWLCPDGSLFQFFFPRNAHRTSNVEYMKVPPVPLQYFPLASQHFCSNSPVPAAYKDMYDRMKSFFLNRGFLNRKSKRPDSAEPGQLGGPPDGTGTGLTWVSLNAKEYFFFRFFMHITMQREEARESNPLWLHCVHNLFLEYLRVFLPNDGQTAGEAFGANAGGHRVNGYNPYAYRGNALVASLGGIGNDLDGAVDKSKCFLMLLTELLLCQQSMDALYLQRIPFGPDRKGLSSFIPTSHSNHLYHSCQEGWMGRDRPLPFALPTSAWFLFIRSLTEHLAETLRKRVAGKASPQPSLAAFYEHMPDEWKFTVAPLFNFLSSLLYVGTTRRDSFLFKNVLGILSTILKPWEKWEDKWKPYIQQMLPFYTTLPQQALIFLNVTAQDSLMSPFVSAPLLPKNIPLHCMDLYKVALTELFKFLPNDDANPVVANIKEAEKILMGPAMEHRLQEKVLDMICLDRPTPYEPFFNLEVGAGAGAGAHDRSHGSSSSSPSRVRGGVFSQSSAGGRKRQAQRLRFAELGLDVTRPLDEEPVGVGSYQQKQTSTPRRGSVEQTDKPAVYAPSAGAGQRDADLTLKFATMAYRQCKETRRVLRHDIALKEADPILKEPSFLNQALSFVPALSFAPSFLYTVADWMRFAIAILGLLILRKWEAPSSDGVVIRSASQQRAQLDALRHALNTVEDLPNEQSKDVFQKMAEKVAGIFTLENPQVIKVDTADVLETVLAKGKWHVCIIITYRQASGSGAALRSFSRSGPWWESSMAAVLPNVDVDVKFAHANPNGALSPRSKEMVLQGQLACDVYAVPVQSPDVLKTVTLRVKTVDEDVKPDISARIEAQQRQRPLDKAHLFGITTPNKEYALKVDSPSDRAVWLKALEIMRRRGRQ